MKQSRKGRSRESGVRNQEEKNLFAAFAALREIRSASVLLAAVLVLGCSNGHPQEEVEEVENIADTVWNEDLELFMEYPPIRAGEAVRFAAHLTDMSGPRPVTEGPADFRFTRDGREVVTVRPEQPVRPGIYIVEATFDSPGPLALTIEIQGATQQGSIQASPLRVYSASEEIPEPAPESPGGVPFLKEQQWTLPFSTAVAEVKKLARTVSAPAEILPLGGRDIQVASPAEGIYSAPENGTPALAQRVAKGQLLGWIEMTPDRRSGMSGSQLEAGLSLVQLQSEIAQAEAAVAQDARRLDLAHFELARLERLLAIEAVPAKRVEEARSEVDIRQAALKASKQVRELLAEQQERIGAQSRDIQQLSQRIPLRSPIDGEVVELSVADGAVVDPRQQLFRILDLRRVWIRAQVVESQSHLLGSLQGADLELPGRQPSLPLERRDLVSVGRVVDPSSRTVAVVWEAANHDGLLKAGMLAQIRMRTEGEAEALAVPASAVLVEENKSVVYLQTAGETFSRRIVTTGMRDRGWVEIASGLAAGERVVVEGAYEIALAARAGESGAVQGHVH